MNLLPAKHFNMKLVFFVRISIHNIIQLQTNEVHSVSDIPETYKKHIYFIRIRNQKIQMITCSTP